MSKNQSNINGSVLAAKSDAATANVATSDDTVKAQPVTTQVKPKRQYAQRRSFTNAYKLKMLSAYDACKNAQERGELLRREGLYQSRIYDWRSQQQSGKLNKSYKSKGDVRVDHLTRENEQLKKKLAQAEAIIDLQKKVSELLGMHILSPNKSEET